MRLGALIIGDEILAGHVHESNSHWLANRLRPMGITLARVEVCTDALPDIQASVQRFLGELELDYVVTSGGLGPTPDDRTMEGIAMGLGVPLVQDDAWVAWMHERVAEGHRRGYFKDPEPNPGLLKMTLLPSGAKAMPNRIGTALGAIVETEKTLLFTLPGVPTEFQSMFDECVAPRLTIGPRMHVAEARFPMEESRFFEVLARLEKEHPGIQIGSYPGRGFITIRATGQKDAAEAVIAAVEQAARGF